jgi:hypothetical protein
MGSCEPEIRSHLLSKLGKKYDFGEILMFLDVEGTRTVVHLVREDTDCPDVHFFIVAGSLDELG